MSLANNVITHQIDPVYFDQNRCEFKISPKVWLSNWQLSDLAVSIAYGKNDGTVGDTRYVEHRRLQSDFTHRALQQQHPDR